MPSDFLTEATGFHSPLCTKCKGLVYILASENGGYVLNCKKSQEVPVRINIGFHTGKAEWLVGGQRLLKKESRRRLSPALPLLCVPFTSLSSELPPFSWKEGVADRAEERGTDRPGPALCFSRARCPAKRQM